MTCLSGHSSSIYNLAINAFFFSQTSDDIEVFILVDRIGGKDRTVEVKAELSQWGENETDGRVRGRVEVYVERGEREKERE